MKIPRITVWHIPSIIAAIAAVVLLPMILASVSEPSRAQQAGSIYCSQNVAYDGTANGATRVFTATVGSGRMAYICGYQINVGGTATNVQLRYGTGTNCGTGTINITPLWVLPIAGKVTDDSAFFRGLLVPAGNDVCVFTSAGNAVQAQIYYTYQ